MRAGGRAGHSRLSRFSIPLAENKVADVLAEGRRGSETFRSNSFSPLSFDWKGPLAWCPPAADALSLSLEHQVGFTTVVSSNTFLKFLSTLFMRWPQKLDLWGPLLLFFTS